MLHVNAEEKALGKMGLPPFLVLFMNCSQEIKKTGPLTGFFLKLMIV
jgi:hypothetical protein